MFFGKVKLNFPTLPQILKEDIKRMVESKTVNITNHPEVKGYLAEELFFKFVKTKPLAVQDASKCITFNVNQVEELVDPATLTVDVLYRLRAYHPVIDAVGLFSQDGGGTILAYFQVSVSLYSEHTTKIGNLFDSNVNKRGYSELTNDLDTIHKYYKEKVVPPALTVYYVYISTSTTSETRNFKLTKDATEHNISYGVLSQSSELYQCLCYR